VSEVAVETNAIFEALSEWLQSFFDKLLFMVEVKDLAFRIFHPPVVSHRSMRCSP